LFLLRANGIFPLRDLGGLIKAWEIDASEVRRGQRFFSLAITGPSFSPAALQASGFTLGGAAEQFNWRFASSPVFQLLTIGPNPGFVKRAVENI